MAIETSTGLRYTSIKYLAETLDFMDEVPSRTVGIAPTNEEVGTGDGSTTIFYLDQWNVIINTLTLYYGATASATSTLTETTDYTVDYDTGKITLTPAGVTTLSTNKIFANYKYLKGLKPSFLQKILLAAEQKVDDDLNTTFTDGTATNPTYPRITDERHGSKTLWDKTFFTKQRPCKDVLVTLAEALDISETEVDLVAGDTAKLPTSGSILVESEIITYTGISSNTLTGCTRGALGSTAATHVTSLECHSTIVKLSGTDEGGSPEFDVLEYGTQFYVGEQGNIYIYSDTLVGNIPQDVPDRLRVSYYYGFDTVPTSITRLAMIYAKRMLAADNISKALVAGRNEFQPEMYNVDEEFIATVLDDYRQLSMGNT